MSPVGSEAGALFWLASLRVSGQGAQGTAPAEGKEVMTPRPLAPEQLQEIARNAPMFVSGAQFVAAIDQLLRAEAYQRERADRLDAEKGDWTGRACLTCNGTGQNNDVQSCRDCAGTGEIWATWKQEAAYQRERAERLAAVLREIDNHRLYTPDRYAYMEIKEMVRAALAEEPKP